MPALRGILVPVGECLRRGQPRSGCASMRPRVRIMRLRIHVWAARAVVLSTLVGCRASSQAVDPFFGRTTIAPPATGQMNNGQYFPNAASPAAMAGMPAAQPSTVNASGQPNWLTPPAATTQGSGNTTGGVPNWLTQPFGNTTATPAPPAAAPNVAMPNVGFNANAPNYGTANVAPNYAQPNYGTANTAPGFTQPNYAQPNYAQPNYAQPNYAQPNYAQPNYGTANVAPNYAQPNYGAANTAPGFAQPNYAQPNYAQPNYAQPNPAAAGTPVTLPAPPGYGTNPTAPAVNAPAYGQPNVAPQYNPANPSTAPRWNNTLGLAQPPAVTPSSQPALDFSPLGGFGRRIATPAPMYGNNVAAAAQPSPLDDPRPRRVRTNELVPQRPATPAQAPAAAPQVVIGPPQVSMPKVAQSTYATPPASTTLAPVAACPPVPCVPVPATICTPTAVLCQPAPVYGNAVGDLANSAVTGRERIVRTLQPRVREGVYLPTGGGASSDAVELTELPVHRR